MAFPFRDPGVPLTLEQSHLRKLTLKTIEADPGSFNMSFWERERSVSKDLCGTTRCLAGWAQFLVRGGVYVFDTGGVRVAGSVNRAPYGALPAQEDAIALLGLTEEEFGGSSPLDVRGLFYQAETVAVARMRGL